MSERAVQALVDGIDYAVFPFNEDEHTRWLRYQAIFDEFPKTGVIQAPNRKDGIVMARRILNALTEAGLKVVDETH